MASLTVVTVGQCNISVNQTLKAASEHDIQSSPSPSQQLHTTEQLHHLIVAVHNSYFAGQ